jgi:hypothetical protein
MSPDNIARAILRITVCVISIFVIAYAGICIHTSYEQEQLEKKSVKTDVFAEVTDKDSRTVIAGRVFIRKYEATVDIGGTKQKINITADIYENINIGDKMKVTVYTLKDKIVDVKYKSVNLSGKK